MGMTGLSKAKILFLLLFSLVLTSCDQEKKNEGEKKAEPTKYTVKRQPLLHKVSTTGRVVSFFDVDIKCKASGQIRRLPFDLSDEVKKGDLLLELDPVDEQRSVKKAYLSVKQSESRLAQARQNLAIAEKEVEIERSRIQVVQTTSAARELDAKRKIERTRSLRSKNFQSQEDLEANELALVIARAEVENVRIRAEELSTKEKSLELKRQELVTSSASLELAGVTLSDTEQRLAETRVYSPIDGIVTARNVQEGQIISSGISNVGGGTTVVTISDVSRLFVLAAVDESQIGLIDEGLRARVRVDAFPRKQFEGEVARISPRGQVTSNVVTFEVKIEVLDKEKSLLKQEMTASVDILIGERESTLVIPAAAIFRKKREAHVELVKGPGTVETPITLGLDTGDEIEVTDGLSEGDIVILQDSDSRWARTQRRDGPPNPLNMIRRATRR